jgi:hypothetical protein
LLAQALLMSLATAPLTLAVPGAACVAMNPKLCDSFVDRCVAELIKDKRLKVLAERDIAQLIGLERQKQLLGCDGGSCIAELAGALGVDAVLRLSFARSDPYFVTTARVLRSTDGAVLASASERVSREGEVFDSVDSIASRFRGELVTTMPSEGGHPLRLVPGIGGLVLGGAGVAAFFWAGSERAQLTQHLVTGTAADTAASTGRLKEDFGVGMMIAGVVVLAASIIWWVFGS